MIFTPTPLAGAYVGLLRNVEGFRFAHPVLLALIPALVALVLWMELGRRAARRALFLYSRATELGAQRPGLGIGHAAGWRDFARALGVEWMAREEATQAIPPAYTWYLGLELRRLLSDAHPNGT